jgi:hypothetical protein
MREDSIWQGTLPVTLHGYFAAGDMDVGIGPFWVDTHRKFGLKYIIEGTHSRYHHLIEALAFTNDMQHNYTSKEMS